MREIRFRAWDERKEIMHYDFEFIRSGIEGNDWIVFKSDKHKLELKPHPFDDPYFSQQLKIMQFTGLLDKNGKEVYEGDIVYMPDPELKENEMCPYKFEVIFNAPLFQLERKTSLGKVTSNMVREPLEIIGNIYENQEWK